MDARLPESRCPKCNQLLDAATSTEGDHHPSPGDISVCINCAEVLTFDEDLLLQPASRKHRRDPRIQRVRRVILKVKKLN